MSDVLAPPPKASVLALPPMAGVLAPPPMAGILAPSMEVCPEYASRVAVLAPSSAA
jgi:hypothetical protein